ncbi:transporter [Candidatus Uhrbacteria bacterium]|nr:transporter [Candidatus Uhrbacteria bacterium]
MKPVLIIALLAVMSAFGDLFIKLAGQGPKFIDLKWFIIGAVLYTSTIFGWFYVMKHIELSSVGVIYAIMTILLLVTIGVVYFHEKLNGYEIVGSLIAIVSIILLSRFSS